MADTTYTVQRSIVIEAPPEQIYPQVADFHDWVSWSPWEGVDPDLRRTYSGAESGTGAVYTWSGNRRAGAGRMEVIEATAPSRVRIDLVFDKPFKARNDTVFTIQPTAAGTAGGPASEVSWTMTGKKTVITKVMGLFTSMDTFLGRDFEKGLARLKAVTEQGRAGPGD